MNYDVSKWNKLIQLEDFKWVLKSILEIGDQNSEWKADFIEFMNSDTSDAQSSFYYDMLPFVRFTDEGPNVGAYTTPDHLIWMNAPHGFGIGTQDYKWEFIYFHECMHQLWDTFGVEKNIERQFGSCDHEILNIASDCVINDFLHINKKMPYPTQGLVTPEWIEQKCGVIYDRKKDTQFGLYEKLLKVKDKLKQPDPQPNQDAKGKKHQNGSQGNQQQQQGGQGQGQGQQQQQGKGQGQGQGQGQKQQQGQGQGQGNQQGNQQQQQGGQGQGQGNQQGNQQGGQSNQQGNSQDQGNQQTGKGGGNLDKFTGYKPFGEEPKFADYKKFGDKIIKKYGGKISGPFGEFVRKCKDSTTEQKKEGMVVRQRRGAAWNKQLDKMMDSFIQQEVIQKHREVERTYHRVKRGSRPLQLGEPIIPGTKIKDDKLNITVAFYIDRSGSMSGCIDKVFSLAYQLSDNILKDFGNESVVGDIGFRYFAFDDSWFEVKKGQTVSDGGGTMPLKELLNVVKQETSSDLINIIITDAQFRIDRSDVVSLVKSMPGMFFLIANEPKPECEDIQKVLKGQFVFIQADPDFTIH